MSQYWKLMNKNGKYTFTAGIVLMIVSLILAIKNETVLFIFSLVCGMYYIGWACWDDRFNIKYVKEAS